MKKKIIIIVIILVFLISCGIIYLNQVILPVKVKALVTQGIEDATQKQVSLSSLQFNIFKGLVLRDLAIYDAAKTILKVKEATCTFLILPIFKKRLIIPTIKLKSPEIFVQRRADNSLDILDFFREPASAGKSRPNLLIYKIKLSGGKIHFRDNTLQPAFSKDIDNLNLLLRLTLPAGIKFSFSFEIPQDAGLPARVNSMGEYSIPAQELRSKIILKNLSPREFNNYYDSPRLSIPAGKIDAAIDLSLKKGGMINAGLDIQAKELIISKNEITIKLNSNMYAELNYSLKNKQFNGSLDILDAMLKPGKFNSILENINGKLEFNPDRLIWSGINFRYLDIDYKTSGVLADFQSPAVELGLSSKDILLKSIFTVKDGELNFSQFSGKYINSGFSATGSIAFGEPPGINADINAGLNIDLNDIKEPLKKFNDAVERIMPGGILQVNGNLKGDINDIKSCAIKAKLSSDLLLLYGLKFQDFLMDYSQQDGIANIPSMRLSLYDGSIEATGKISLNSEDFPYWFNSDIKEIKLEKLKLDTPLKDSDISGIIQAQAEINGFYNDLSRLSGAGMVLISEGRLWQLDLFKGIGALIFSNDFSDVVFNEGSCGFVIRDKYISTDNLELKSNLCGISGPLRIGFDGSLEGALNVKVSDEAPLTGTIKDITTAILGTAERFGVIKIGGTLREPELKFKPAVVDILKSFKDTFLNKK